MPDWNAINAFMAAVVPWPAESEPGYINLHFSMPPKPGELKKKYGAVPGFPWKTAQELINRSSWMAQQANFKDQWFCLSRQKEAGVNTRGKPKAIRNLLNSTHMKAIWADVDFGKKDKATGLPVGYQTYDEALLSLLQFCKLVGLPAPSAVVKSGGGLHAYWISRTPLLKADWQAYAQGLKNLLLQQDVKCDAGLTTDACRILRMPGSKNFKYDPPLEVVFDTAFPLRLYDFDPKLVFLQKAAGPVMAPSSPTEPHNIFADGAANAFAAGPSAAFLGLDKTETLAAGIDKHAEFLVQPEAIFKKCQLYRDALLTGWPAGAGQPLWNLAILGTTFMERGEKIAHAISATSPYYNAADTQALYDRKVSERASQGIGYPSCASFESNGSTACATCPLRPIRKSPLNIRPEPGPEVRVTATVTTPDGDEIELPDLPPGFVYNDDNIVCYELVKKDKDAEEDAEPEILVIPLFKAQMFAFWLQTKNGKEFLNLTCTVDMNKKHDAAIELGKICAQGFRQHLGDQRILINPQADPRQMEIFFMSTFAKLRKERDAAEPIPFGWYYDVDGNRKGFTYAGRVWLDDGTDRPCGVVDPNIARKYKPKGTMENWLKAANTVFHRERSELTAIVLTAFASPLVALSGKNSFMASAYGSDSGAGKTSASQIGMSVWGHPILTKATETQTAVNLTHVMKSTVNLPLYWDEITDDAGRERVRKAFMEADGGKERGRNLDGVRSQEEGMWQLGLQYTANGSLLSYLRQQNKNTVAQIVRVLEWEVKKIDGGPGAMPEADASALVSLSLHNYGVMGLVYAKFLALNHSRVADDVRRKINEVQIKTNSGTTERMWVVMVALYSLAAQYMQELGLYVDPAAIEQFMLQTMAHNLRQRDTLFSSGGSVDNSESVLSHYLNHIFSTDRLIWTDEMHMKAGRPKSAFAVNIQPLNNPQRGIGIGGVAGRFVTKHKSLVIDKVFFDKYLEDQKHAEVQIYASLGAAYDLEINRLNIGAHTPFGGAGVAQVLVLHLRKDQPLYDFMLTKVPPDVRAKLQAEPDEETAEDSPVVTGFENDPVTGLASAASVNAFVRGATAGAQ